jgi:hypothetical protein
MKWLQLHKVIEEQSHQLESALPGLYFPAIENSACGFLLVRRGERYPANRAPAWWL